MLGNNDTTLFISGIKQNNPDIQVNFKNNYISLVYIKSNEWWSVNICLKY